MANNVFEMTTGAGSGLLNITLGDNEGFAAVEKQEE